ncbi:MAG: type II toxin-antitoxin system HicB family antitoxin [Deltaproteobacteria bacterium]|nr:type II toxin-antitoxin system HicB family antitoxin [Deltaproteobacteria bacterium]
MAEKEYSYTVFFEPASEGGYIVSVPAFPGLVTEGDTIEEAREMARDAIRAYLESLIKDGVPIPEEEGTMLEKVADALDVSSS